MILFQNVILKKYIPDGLPKQPKTELSAWRGCFYIRLAYSFDGICTTDALERFDKLDFWQFFAKLKKSKIAMRDQDENEECFDQICTIGQTIAA